MPHVRVAIIGAGFAGVGMAIALKRRGTLDFVVFERADDLGGTWRDNTYPGCQCDVPSHLYSYSFAPNSDWSRTYSPQPEIWDYLRGCARRFGVLPHILLQHAVHRSTWDEDAGRWVVETGRGTWTADVLILANGALSEPAIPPIPGRERFRGTTFHSASWNRNADLRRRRVAVIGTGASAVQIVPSIQPDVERLHLFQR
ncbi:MAG: flavin-containing monooxygenase, partial [Actinomycetota bacterium]